MLRRPRLVRIITIRNIDLRKHITTPLDPEAPRLDLLPRDARVLPDVRPRPVGRPEKGAPAAGLAVQGDAAARMGHGAVDGGVDVARDVRGDVEAAVLADAAAEGAPLATEVLLGHGGEVPGVGGEDTREEGEEVREIHGGGRSFWVVGLMLI